MFCLYYDIFIKILKFSYPFQQNKLQKIRLVILKKIDKYQNDLKTHLNSCNFFCSKTYENFKILMNIS